jgi:hypothetical protein
LSRRTPWRSASIGAGDGGDRLERLQDHGHAQRAAAGQRPVATVQAGEEVAVVVEAGVRAAELARGVPASAHGDTHVFQRTAGRAPGPMATTGTLVAPGDRPPYPAGEESS